MLSSKPGDALRVPSGIWRQPILRALSSGGIRPLPAALRAQPRSSIQSAAEASVSAEAACEEMHKLSPAETLRTRLPYAAKMARIEQLYAIAGREITAEDGDPEIVFAWMNSGRST